MIRLRAEDVSGQAKGWELSYEEFEQFISSGEADPGLEVHSANLTQGQWKPLGELALYKKYAAARDGGGSLGLRDVVDRVQEPKPMISSGGETMWTCNKCGKNSQDHLTECLWCKAPRGSEAGPARASAAVVSPKFRGNYGAGTGAVVAANRTETGSRASGTREVERLAGLERTAATLWMVGGILQLVAFPMMLILAVVSGGLLIGLAMSTLFFGIMNIVISRWHAGYAKMISNREARVPEVYRRFKTIDIIWLFVHLFLGGFWGFAMNIYCLYVDSQVLKNAHHFAPLENRPT